MTETIDESHGFRLPDSQLEVVYVNRHKKKPMITRRGDEVVLP